MLRLSTTQLPSVVPRRSLEGLLTTADEPGIDLQSQQPQHQQSALVDVDAETHEKFLWLLICATSAECVTTCFVPAWTLAVGFKLNASATMLNIIGPFLEGLTYGYEQLPAKGAASAGISIACMQFRSAFLGVFTSFPFMVDHAGDLSIHSIWMGPMYICGSILAACLSFQCGKDAVQLCMTSPVTGKWMRVMANRKYPSLMACTLTFIATTVLTAAFGPRGFVRDPKEPQFIGSIRVADGEELFLGIFMSCSAILLSDVICSYLRPRPDALGDLAALDWGTLACNFVACLLAWTAYAVTSFSSEGMQHNLLGLKFVSSFCGSISCFSASISYVMRMWQSGRRDAALWNLGLHILVGLLFVPYLNKHK